MERDRHRQLHEFHARSSETSIKKKWNYQEV